MRPHYIPSLQIGFHHGNTNVGFGGWPGSAKLLAKWQYSFTTDARICCGMFAREQM